MDKSENQFNPNELSGLRESIVDKVTRDAYAQIKADDKGIVIGFNAGSVAQIRKDVLGIKTYRDECQLRIGNLILNESSRDFWGDDDGTVRIHHTIKDFLQNRFLDKGVEYIDVSLRVKSREWPEPQRLKIVEAFDRDFKPEKDSNS